MIESVIKSKGLYTNPNPFSVSPEGALIRADNVVIDEDGTIRSRRGQQKLTLPSWTTDYRAEKVWWYNNRIWIHAVKSGSTDIIYPVDWDFSYPASFSSIGEGYKFSYATTNKVKLRTCEANKRLLLGTSSGIQRIPASTNIVTINSNSPYSAGVPKGLDGRNTALNNTVAYNPMPATSTCAYRCVWKFTDINGIVTVGPPSGRCIVRNTNAAARTPDVVFGIPAKNSFIATGPSNARGTSVLQIYRTNFFSVLPDGTYPDPGDDMYLACELTPTSADIAAYFITYTDIVVDALLGEPLYTNLSQDGELSGREEPPAAQDIVYYNDTAFYINTANKHQLIFSILAVDSSGIGTFKGVTIGDTITVGGMAMKAVAAANEFAQVYNFAVDQTTGTGSEVVRVLKTTESFVYKYNLWSNTNNGEYYAYNITGPDDIVGKVLIQSYRQYPSTSETLAACFNTTRLDSPPQFIPTPTMNTAATSGLARFIDSVVNNGTTVTLTYAAAHGRTTNDQIAFYWDSRTTASTNTQIPPGNYTVTVTGATTLTFPTPSGSVVGNDVAASIALAHKTIATCKSTNNRRLNRIYYSAPGEPEGVPIQNYFDIGSSDAEALIGYKLGQSLFVFKEDGLFRITGSFGQFQVDEFDPTVHLLAPESVAVVNNAIYCLTDQGVTRITESGATVISREIENELFAAISINTSVARKESFGVGYDDDRKYILWMPSSASDTRCTQAFVYNMFTKSWTKRTDQANHGLVGRRNDVLTDVQKLYTIKNKDNWLTQERKNNNIYDYADESSVISAYQSVSGNEIIFSGSDTDWFLVNNLYVANSDVTKRGICTSLSGGTSSSLMTNLNGYWTFNSTGNDSVGTNHATVSGATYGPEKIGNGIRFVNDRARLGTKLTQGTFTFAGWIKAGVQTAVDGSIFVDRGTARGLFYNSSNRLVFWDSVQRFTGSINITQGVLTHIAVVVNNGDGIIYVNGAQDITFTGTTWPRTGIGEGFDQWGTTDFGDEFVGSVDEFGFWTRVLTGAEILELYNSGSGITYPYPTHVVIESSSNETNGIASTRPASWGSVTTITAYKPIEKTVTYNHFIGTGVENLKQFNEVFFTFDQPYFTKATLSFNTDKYPTTTSVNQWGYAYNYWNTNFPWSLRVYTGQLLGRTLRNLVPTSSQYCSQMLVSISNSRPWENFNIRGLHLKSVGSSTNVQRDNA